MQQKCQVVSIDWFSILQGAKYNIPVSIWLPENYPSSPPIVYVNPASDMVIKTNHPFVDASGVVSSTYLRNWSQPQSTLMIMCNDISIQFGKDPPLFQKGPGWVPPAPAQHHHTSPQRQYPPERSQSPSVQQAPSHSHTFQAANPMVRSAFYLSTWLFSVCNVPSLSILAVPLYHKLPHQRCHALASTLPPTSSCMEHVCMGRLLCIWLSTAFSWKFSVDNGCCIAQ